MIRELFELTPAIYGIADEIEMLPQLRANGGANFVIYGAGQGGEFVLSWVKRVYSLMPDFIVDKNPKVESIDGVRVISTEEYKKLRLKKCFVIISICKYHDDMTEREEIDRVIKEAQGTEAQYIVYDSYPILQPYDLYWFHYVKTNIALFEKTLDWLLSSLSKETMIYFLRTIILGERYSGITFPEKYKYWGIDSEEKRLFEISKEEVLLNAGAAKGDTIYQFLKHTDCFKKIIAVEASETEYKKLKHNIDMLDKNTLEKIQADNVFLGEEYCRIDDLYGNEGISLINMDIEGAELSALKSALHTIQRNRPVLSICVYHKVEDLIVIPTWIRSVVDDYVFALRKYPSSWYTYIPQILQQNEVVLYAIPKERYIAEKI